MTKKRSLPLSRLIIYFRHNHTIVANRYSKLFRRIVVRSPFILVLAIAVGAVGAPILFLVLSMLEVSLIVPTELLRTMPPWLFLLGSIATGALLLATCVGLTNWEGRRKRNHA
jgi:hypothetical protein